MSATKRSSSSDDSEHSEPLLEEEAMFDDSLEAGTRNIGGKFIRNQGRNIMLSVCSFILVTEFCERLAYYGLTGSLTSFFSTNLGFSSVTASNLVSLFSTVNYLTPMLGAWVADTILGRYRTILYFACIYVVGMWMCVFAAMPGHEMTWLFMLGLFGCVCFGSGGIKSSVVVLGADQFDLNDPDQVRQKDSFFNYFYWSINIGASFSYGYLAYLAVNGSGAISRSWGYFASFAIPASVFVIGVLIFVSGTKRYELFPPQGSEFSKFCEVVWFAARRSRTGILVLTGAFVQVPAFFISTIAIFISDTKEYEVHLALSVLAMVLIVGGCIILITFSQTTEWLDAARRSRPGGSYSDLDVNNAADIMRLFPYLAFLIMFWAIYNQMSGNFVLQACQMDVRVGGGQFSGAQLSIMDSTVILLFIPIFDRFVYPLFDRIGHPLTLMRRIGCGFFLTGCSMVVAGYVEIKRRDAKLLHPLQTAHCAEGGQMSDFSIYLQIPQYLLIGLGEILASITSYELFYSQVPESMRSVCQGLNLLTTSMGGMVTTSVNNICSSWIKNDLNEGHLEYVFFAMAGLMALNLLTFIYVSRTFVPKTFVPSDALTGEEDAMDSDSMNGGQGGLGGNTTGGTTDRGDDYAGQLPYSGSDVTPKEEGRLSGDDIGELLLN